MAALQDLRYPTSTLAKFLSSLLAIALFFFVAVSAVAGFLVYQIVRPTRAPASYDLSVMMGHPVTLSFPVAGGGPGGGEREGFFFPGLRGAPTIIVCHGYASQRSDVLTLVTALQDQQFNVFLFDFAGHGNSPAGTTLGYREVAELRSAMQTIATRDDVDPNRFGLWGVDMGGYVVLEVATTDPRVKAFIVDDAYSDPRVLVQSEVKRSGLTVLPFVDKFSDFGFRMLNYQFKSQPPVTGQLARTKGVPKLFIVSEDRQVLATETMDMFNRAPDPKTVTRTNTAYSVMSDDSRKNYETQVVGFFLQNLPPTVSAAAAAKN
ncbi:MAG TPA: alpha/beta fold hydrolase [Candidatus Acidoferrales bacterium]